MKTNSHVEIAVFGESDMMTFDIHTSWLKASVNLRDPVSAELFMNAQTWDFSAAMIDVRYAAEVMLPLMDALDAKAIPFVFVVPGHLVGAEAGPFVLSSRSSDIDDILEALAAQDLAVRH